ncbi:hypothetical protein H9651_04280 [Microbacterium sp. Sa4CUA7]|uniref:Uncharacterized protein n=1 Tax=Microbacterium pullorum TaxID=2762236 RepID=A0ABR8S045_9MICO|nr:hypothetical protein [Microbacterium pullorum]MBD7956843.1 hypothetical protein [Microbacterium pullorum]
MSTRTRQACERVLAEAPDLSPALAEIVAAFEGAWGEHPSLTPRQAYAIALTLDMWADGDLRSWVDDPREPMHEIGPFVHFDRRALFRIDGNRAWVQSTRDRCYAISHEIQRGILPFNRPGAYIDELLIAAALREAEAYLSDMPEIFESIMARAADESEDSYSIGDEDWDSVSDWFDDICQWDEWEVLVMTGHPLVPAVLDARHPFTWFDVVPASGAGYLQRLQGLAVEDDE